MILVVEGESRKKAKQKKVTATVKPPYERSSFEISGSEGDLGYAHVIEENTVNDVTRSDAFKAWFGDWENDPENSSKCVGENGPLTVYHGTDSNFRVFRKGTGVLGDGFYFSVYEGNASQYGNTKGYYLNIRRPLDLGSMWNESDEGVESFIRVAAQILEKSGYKPNVNLAFENVEEYEMVLDALLYGATKNPWRLFRKCVEAQGYDGIVYDDEWVAFHPNQIKHIRNSTFTATDRSYLKENRNAQP